MDCPWASHTPSGRLPCVEVYDSLTKDHSLLCNSESNEVAGVECVGNLREAEYIVEQLETILGMNRIVDGLEGQSIAEKDGLNNALYCLLMSKVVPGVLASLWLDVTCCTSVTMQLYGQGLPWPLRQLLPLQMKRVIRKYYGHGYFDDTSPILCDAVKALESCVQLIHNRKQMYAIDPEMPLSSDILLVSLLSMIRCLPIHASLREASKKLDWYLDGIFRRHLQETPIMASAVADTKWSRLRSTISPLGSNPASREETRSDSLIEGKAATYWLTAVGVVAAGYVALLLSTSTLELQILDSENGS